MASRRVIAAKTTFALDDTTAEKDLRLIWGDVVDTTGPAGGGRVPVRYRGRTGTVTEADLGDAEVLELYFLDVGQGDATFIVTPGGKKILIDGGQPPQAKTRMGEAEQFLTWRYELDKPNSPGVDIDLLVLSHADEDHIGGLIPLLANPFIRVKRIVHSGIATYQGPAVEGLGKVEPVDGTKYLTTRHDTLADLADDPKLSDNFAQWRDVITLEGITYGAVKAGDSIDIADPAVTIDVLGPLLTDVAGHGKVYKWFGTRPETINGHSVVLALAYKDVRVILSGDINAKGGRHLCADPAIRQGLDGHVFKAPHHGSHEYDRGFLQAVNPQITAISSGSDPDYGHPRANFLGAVGQCSRSNEPLLFCTELAAVYSADKQATQQSVFERNSTGYAADASAIRDCSASASRASSTSAPTVRSSTPPTGSSPASTGPSTRPSPPQHPTAPDTVSLVSDAATCERRSPSRGHQGRHPKR